MDNDQNIDHMEQHLRCLYDWTQTAYPNALLEVRCIHPTSGIVLDERFPCTAAGYERAIGYAVWHNDQNYNVYVTANPLKPSTARTAKDEDVEIALYQSLDADGVDDPSGLIAERSGGFEPSFIVRTGSIPKPRCQVYWQQSEPITDMAQWRRTQAGLAQQFGTDQTIRESLTGSTACRLDQLSATTQTEEGLRRRGDRARSLQWRRGLRQVLRRVICPCRANSRRATATQGGASARGSLCRPVVCRRQTAAVRC